MRGATARPNGAARRALLSLLVFAATAPFGSAARSDEPTIAQRVETAARDLPFFAWGGFLHDRLDETWLPSNMPAADRERYATTLGGLLAAWRRLRAFSGLLGATPHGGTGEEDVVGLLKSPDARVRTLALALLFDREDPKWLPVIAERTTADAP